jgi:ribonucleoside-diphosphate reductase alpha chain
VITRPPTADDELTAHVWHRRYRHGEEADPDASFRRVARALSAVERHDAPGWERAFYDMMRRRRFLPGGRILAGAGTGRRVTLFNCFVMGEIEDSIEGIFRALQEGALTLQQGGGIGCDFSTLRPRGMAARETGRIASGPVSFMHVWDSMCATMLSSEGRRGAMMGTLRCDHPDIELFIDAKREASALSHFNLSVLVSDDFLRAVRDDLEWALVFPGRDRESAREATCHVRARSLWDRLMRAAYDSAEPGVLFVDRINRLNNLSYCESVGATNPCGEIPLPPYGACDLGSINLVAFVRDAFTSRASLDEEELGRVARTAARFLDNVIDISDFPLPEQVERARAGRRIGLGLMGLADALVMLGIRYDSEAARGVAQAAMRTICHEAYRASVELARERGGFPMFDRERYVAAPFVAGLPDDIRDGIARFGIRNSHLTAIAPTGSISLLAGGVSSGLEPLLAERVERKVLQGDGSWRYFATTPTSVRLWQRNHPGLPPAFVPVADMAPLDHLALQAALQPFVDNAISKTLTVSIDISFDDFSGLFVEAHALGLKGCTVFRPGGVRGCTERPAGRQR